MSQISELLGEEYDAPTRFPQDIGLYPAKRDVALAGVNRAEAAGDDEGSRLLKWELAIHDLIVAPAANTSPSHGAPYEKYAEFYGLLPETVAYARERASETADVILKIRYLEFVSLRSPPSGRAWLEQQRELLRSYREYVDGTLAAPTEEADMVGVQIDRALNGLGLILAQGSVVPPTEASSWAEWILAVAERSRDFPQKDEFWTKQQRHRWIADYLTHLTQLPAEAIPDRVRRRPLELLDDAAAYYGSTPLNDTFAIAVAEADALIRKYFGETGTHERMIRTQVAAIEARAELHRSTGNGLLTAEFTRQALTLVTTHRQYFTDEDVARLGRGAQAALHHAVANSEFAEISIPMVIPSEVMDLSGKTARETVENIVRDSTDSIPRYAQLEADQDNLSEETPLRSSIGRTVVGRGKVVGQARTPEENRALDVERRVVMTARLLGAAIANTIVIATDNLGLSVDDLADPLKALELDQGTVAMLRHGCDRLIAKDFVSAAHVLVPHFEDALRQALNALGVDTTKFKRGPGRTDDATLGTLLGSSLPDGSSVRKWLGDDLSRYVDAVYASQTGLNLRHEFAHGLARPEHCAPDIVGLMLSLYYILAAHVGRPSSEPGMEAGVRGGDAVP